MNPVPFRSLRRSPPARQQGIILIVALLFLVLLTIVGVSSSVNTTLEERMAGNARDQQIAFQAAESALRDAEIDLETAIGGIGNRDPLTVALFAPLCNTSFINGICTVTPNYQTEIVTAAGWDWTSATKTVRYGTYTGADPLPSVSQQPRYVIERLDAAKDDLLTTPPTRHFRISARGWGANATTAVTLQSVYKMPMN